MRTLTGNRLAKGCVTGALAGATALGLVGCDAAEEDPAATSDTNTTMSTGTEESDAGNDAVDVAAIQDEGAGSDGVYDGTYDNEFLNEVNSFDGERITVSATVNEVISEQAFTIGGIEDPDVEPLLVIHKNSLDFVEEGQLVLVTGVVHKAYDTEAAEQQLGMQLENAELSEWGPEPYVETDTVGELADTA